VGGYLKNIKLNEIRNNIDLSFSKAELVVIDEYFYVELSDLVLKSKINNDKKIYIDGKIMPIFFSHKYFLGREKNLIPLKICGNIVVITAFVP